MNAKLLLNIDDKFINMLEYVLKFVLSTACLSPLHVDSLVIFLGMITNRNVILSREHISADLVEPFFGSNELIPCTFRKETHIPQLYCFTLNMFSSNRLAL